MNRLAVALLPVVITACASAQPLSRTITTRTQISVGHGPSAPVTVGSSQWLQAATVNPQMLVGSDGQTYLGLWIDTPAMATATERAPLDVALVVDTSGSMSGAKIANARLAASSFIDGLADGDIVSLYAFSNSVRQLAPPTVVDATSRSLLLSHVNGLYASGGTNLYSGLSAAQTATDSAPPTHPVRRIVLISDGQANIGPRSPEDFAQLAARGTESGTQISAIGVGLDYDENTLGTLAVRSAGRLYHLESPEQMAAILHDELELLGQTVASNTVIELTPEPGVIIEGTDNLRVDRDGDRVRIPIGSLYSRQHREVLLRVRVPTTRYAPGARPIAHATLRYDLANTGTRRSSPVAINVALTRDPSEARAQGPERVVAMVTRFEAAQSQLRAAQMLNEGRAREAEIVLQQTEENLRHAARASRSDETARRQLDDQANAVSRGRSAARRAAAAPSAAAGRGAALQNSSAAMHAYGY